MPTIFKYDKGIKFRKKPENFTLIADPTTAKAATDCNAALITHAHTDHSLAFPNEGIKVYSTRTASELYEKLTSRTTKNTQFLRIITSKILNYNKIFLLCSQLQILKWIIKAKMLYLRGIFFLVLF